MVKVGMGDDSSGGDGGAEDLGCPLCRWGLKLAQSWMLLLLGMCLMLSPNVQQGESKQQSERVLRSL